MTHRDLPELRPTGRTYVDRTRGGWLQGGGIERHVFPGRRWPWLLLATLAVAGALFLAYRWS